jgi:DNA-binding NarL/FixJ family response regulator/PAS domain-containing protein
MHTAILKRLADQVEDFLPRWAENIDKAGYLAITAAKPEDYILGYRWFLEPLLQAVEQGHNPPFAELIQNVGNWADKIIGTSRRHRSRGVSGDMFIGCFKTLVHSILEMIDEGEDPPEQKAAAVRFIRNWADAYETIIVCDWTALSQQEVSDSLDLANRRLSMEKTKYENIIDSISDLVFVLDAHGSVLEANRSARQYFPKEPEHSPIWEVLPLEGHSMEEVLAQYSQNVPREIVIDNTIYFHCVFAPLKKVSLLAGYLAILRDISSHVKQREILEATVAERTAALQNEKVQLQEMNVTLRTVMKSIDKELETFQENVGDIVRTALLPALDKLRKERSEPIRKSYLDILEDQLLRLPQGGEADRDALLLKLTPTEMKVSQFIQAGSTTKDIAEALNLAIVTIQTHRRNIRRKLDLQNRNMNLYTFLNHARRSRVGERQKGKAAIS